MKRKTLRAARVKQKLVKIILASCFMCFFEINTQKRASSKAKPKLKVPDKAFRNVFVAEKRSGS